MNEAKIISNSKSQNTKTLIQIVDDNDKNIGQAKISKVLKTMYHVKYAGKTMKVKKNDIMINTHGQNQTNLMNLKESLNNIVDFEDFKNESYNNPFNTTLLNISRIIELGDMVERNFQNWLKDNDIWWSQRGSNLENITIYEKDYYKIKNSEWGDLI